MSVVVCGACGERWNTVLGHQCHKVNHPRHQRSTESERKWVPPLETPLVGVHCGDVHCSTTAGGSAVNCVCACKGCSDRRFLNEQERDRNARGTLTTQPMPALRTTPCAVDCRHPLCSDIRERERLKTPIARDLRQRDVLAWARATFGEDGVTRRERVRRFLEEAVELAQAEGMPWVDVTDLVTHVYDKPVGDPAQEVGGIGVTLLAYCEVAGLSADAEEAKELARVVALPRSHFQKRQNTKADAGVAVRVAVDGEGEEK